jgi:hypothetical protein
MAPLIPARQARLSEDIGVLQLEMRETHYLADRLEPNNFSDQIISAQAHSVRHSNA